MQQDKFTRTMLTAIVVLLALNLVFTAGGRIVLRSPMDGLVLTLHAVPGETARTDEALATVGDNSTVWVWADLYERDIRSVVRGQAAGRLDDGATVLLSGVGAGLGWASAVVRWRR